MRSLFLYEFVNITRLKNNASPILADGLARDMSALGLVSKLHASTAPWIPFARPRRLR
jgi:hypothetical protein